MKLTLVKNGIFPVVKDKNGKPIKKRPDTGYTIAGTLQGEGKYVGTPALFIRTSGCNLRCTWQLPDGSIDICDTPYSSHNPIKNTEWNIDDIVATAKQNIGNMEHIVITGGEPMHQKEAVAILVKKLKKELPYVILTLETNGTIFDKNVAKHIDLYSISPKLNDSVPTPQKLDKHFGKGNYRPENYTIAQLDKSRVNIDSLQKFINMCYSRELIFGKRYRNDYHDVQLKFVVGGEHQDAVEIKEQFLNKLKDLHQSDIILMPVGSTAQVLKKTSFNTARLAIENGWSYTPRLQVDLYGNKPGV